MDLYVCECAIRLDELVGVTGVAVHVSVRVWSTAVAEKVHDLMHRFLVVAEIVPEHGGIFEVRLWVALLCVNEDWELAWVSEEENRRVVEHPIKITIQASVRLEPDKSHVCRSLPFLCVELDGESTRIAGAVC